MRAAFACASVACELSHWPKKPTPMSADRNRNHRPVRMSNYPLLSSLFVCAEHCDGFDFNQQFRPAQMRLDARRSREWIETLLLEELGALHR